MPRILLTNDDGIEAPGLWAAAQALAQVGEVTVVAPASEQSGMSAANGLRGTVAIRRGDGAVYGVPGVQWVAAATTPASCIGLGLRLYCPKPDLVAAGINPGCNLGRDVIASGTVSAAIVAALAGYPAVAASVDRLATLEWEAAAMALAAVAGVALDHADAMRGTVLNLNAPSMPLSMVRDVVLTRLSDWEYSQFLQLTETDAGVQCEYVFEGWRVTGEPGTDAWAVGEGCISLTPLRPTLALALAAPIEATLRAEVRDALLGTTTPLPADNVPTGVPGNG